MIRLMLRITNDNAYSRGGQRSVQRNNGMKNIWGSILTRDERVVQFDCTWHTSEDDCWRWCKWFVDLLDDHESGLETGLNELYFTCWRSECSECRCLEFAARIDFWYSFELLSRDRSCFSSERTPLTEHWRASISGVTVKNCPFLSHQSRSFRRWVIKEYR